MSNKHLTNGQLAADLREIALDIGPGSIEIVPVVEICEALRVAANAIEQLAHDGKDAMRLRRKLIGAQNAAVRANSKLRALESRHSAALLGVMRALRDQE